MASKLTGNEGGSEKPLITSWKVPEERFRVTNVTINAERVSVS